MNQICKLVLPALVLLLGTKTHSMQKLHTLAQSSYRVANNIMRVFVPTRVWPTYEEYTNRKSLLQLTDDVNEKLTTIHNELNAEVSKNYNNKTVGSQSTYSKVNLYALQQLKPAFFDKSKFFVHKLHNVWNKFIEEVAVYEKAQDSRLLFPLLQSFYAMQREYQAVRKNLNL